MLIAQQEKPSVDPNKMNFAPFSTIELKSVRESDCWLKPVSFCILLLHDLQKSYNDFACFRIRGL